MSGIAGIESPNIPLFTVNGMPMPNPARDYNEMSEQLVKSTRNAKGEVVAQTINRRLNKFDSLTWPYLTVAQVSWLKQQIKEFDCTLGYWDSEEARWITREYYWGDFSATPCEWEIVHDGYRGAPEYYKRPSKYKDVKVNLIDKGLSSTGNFTAGGGRRSVDGRWYRR